MRSPRSSMLPLVTSPRWPCNKLDTARKVVVLPAPLPPKMVTILPLGTCNDTPFKTKMTWL